VGGGVTTVVCGGGSGARWTTVQAATVMAAADKAPAAMSARHAPDRFTNALMSVLLELGGGGAVLGLHALASGVSGMGLNAMAKPGLQCPGAMADDAALRLACESGNWGDGRSVTVADVTLEVLRSLVQEGLDEQRAMRVDLAALRAGQERLQERLLGELERLLEEQQRLLEEQEQLRSGQDRLRADVMERADRLENRLNAVRDDIATNFGRADRVEQKAEAIGEQVRLLGAELTAMQRQIQRLKADVAELRGER